MSGRVRLLVVNHTTLFSGAEQILCDLLVRLHLQDVDVLGVVAPGSGPLVARLADIGVPSFQLPVPHLAGARAPIPFGRGLVQWTRFTQRFAALLRELGPDIVYASSPHAAIAAEPGLTRARIPWLWQMPDLVRPTTFNRLALRRALRRSDVIVAISKAIVESLRSLGADSSQIDLIYGGVDAGAFRRSATGGAEVRRELAIPTDAPLVGMFGQVTPWKGWHVLVASVPRIVAGHPGTHFLFVGRPTRPEDHEYATELSRTVSEAGVAPAVRWTGFRTDVARLMGACDVVVHASVRPEPLGLVVMEGMAAGAAVVCTRGGGTEEMLTDGVTGLVVPPGDPAALTAAVVELLADPVRRAVMGGRAAEEVATRFTHETRVARFGELLRTTARRPRG